MSSEPPRAPAPSLPVSWRTPDGTEVAAGRSQVILPDQADVQQYAEPHRVCGRCKHFNRAEGQQRMKAQRFVEQLVREHRWKVSHLCSPLNQLGLCGQHESGAGGNEGGMLTGSLHRACDAFRPDLSVVRGASCSRWCAGRCSSWR